MAAANDTQRSIAAIWGQCAMHTLGAIAGVACIVKLVSLMIQHQIEITSFLSSVRLFGNTITIGWAFWTWFCLVGYFACVTAKTGSAGHIKTSLCSLVLAIISLCFAGCCADSWTKDGGTLFVAGLIVAGYMALVVGAFIEGDRQERANNERH